MQNLFMVQNSFRILHWSLCDEWQYETQPIYIGIRGWNHFWRNCMPAQYTYTIIHIWYCAVIPFCGGHRSSYPKLSDETMRWCTCTCTLLRVLFADKCILYNPHDVNLHTEFQLHIVVCVALLLLLLFALRLFIGFVSIHRSFKLIRGYQIEHRHTHTHIHTQHVQRTHIPAQIHCLWIICRSKSKFWADKSYSFATRFVIIYAIYIILIRNIYTVAACWAFKWETVIFVVPTNRILIMYSDGDHCVCIARCPMPIAQWCWWWWFWIRYK